MPVKAVYASVQDIGKNLKKTKKHYVWKFNVDGKDHILELFSSTISGKKKVMVDGKITYEGQKMLSSNFLHVINVDRSTVNVYQSGDKYDIMINGQPFSQLYSGQGRNNEYGDENAPGHSYGFSKSVTSKVGDKYNKDKGLRKNAERDEYATRAKYDGDKYYTNDEKIDSWTDVDSKVSHHRRRDHNGSDRYNDEYRRNGSDENNDYDSYESRSYTRSKTFGGQNNFDEYANRQNTRHHTNQHQLRRPSLSDNTGVGTDFDNFNKENQGNDSGTKNLQRGATQPLTKQTTTEVKSFFDLDTADRKTEQTSSQTKTQNQTINNDFFNFGNTTAAQKEEPKTSAPSIQKQHSMPAPVTTNDLIDFGGPSVTDINDLYKQTPQSNQVFDLTTLTGTTTPAVTTTTTVTTATTNIDLTNTVQLKSELERVNPEPSKKDLWNSDLVSLSDIGNTNTTNNANKQPEFIQFQVPLPGTTSNTSSMNTMNNNTSFNTMNTMGMMNSNTPNMMGNMGMMNSGMNQMGMMSGGFGQPNMMMQGMGFNTNMNNMNYGMNMNMGGYGMGGMGMNQGMGGFGGMYNTQMTGAGGFY